ncbi:hypothetical protein BP5796_11811 [Coleophoma crateriformis]|uniref:Autophagy-related protein 1 n=1 Tax=Coleophoma crateriformis TaxID=565419 RepID=A0A3D8QEF3_9HELO|nr:hypothetical protein BP5796_11811 [Coleophoma crateriformis]
MEEEATQPAAPLVQFDEQQNVNEDKLLATQIVIDPRRLGQHNSGLTDEDLTDVFCILHPASLPACRATAMIAEASPEHTLVPNSAAVKFKDNKHRVDSFDLASNGIVSHDIALRLSAKLKDPRAGHCFGRNPARCDFVMGHADEVKRISNVHFRIFINEYGIIMLEDQSTNGTVVDKVILRGKDKENGGGYRHTLENGAIITLAMTPPQEDFRFIVRIPQRDETDAEAFRGRLTDYFMNMKLEHEKGKVQTPGEKKEPLNLFATQNMVSSLSRPKEWRGGSKYNKVCMIGRGAFAVVHKMTRKFDGVPFAAKELEKRRFMKNGILDQKVESEMKIMRKITHENIVQYIEHIDWEDYLFIIMEFVPGGDLGSLVEANGPLSELTVKSMSIQLLSALKYLHNMGITHRDVKPDNILIQREVPFHVKLTDFGLSKMVDSEETFLRTFCGTLLYCAPEVYTEYREFDATGKRNMRGRDKRALPPQRYGHAVDIWSLAGVLFYAFCGRPPFPVKTGTTYQELLSRIMAEPLDIRPLQHAQVSDNGIRFVRNMLHTRPEHRATIADLEASPWLNSTNTEMAEDDEEYSQNFDEFDEKENLERGTSQLSIHEEYRQVDHSGEFGSSDVTEIQQPEIPSSFNTSDGNYSENYSFVQNARGGYGGRLFGEVDVSALGSSGAIPSLSDINLPLPSQHDPQLDESLGSRGNQVSQSDQDENTHAVARPSIEVSHPDSDTRHMEHVNVAKNPMPPPPVPNFQHAVRDYDLDKRAERSSSLMGAESMVGHLNMGSPSDTPSPAAERLASPSLDPNYNIGASLRRRREDEDGEGWWPEEVKASKRRKSNREVVLPMPTSIFWDPKDKSTHHENYPRMTSSEFEAFERVAKENGEEFRNGGRFFNKTMQSFRSSRSPSIEPDATHRATSEPTKEEGRRMLMKRDDRKLGVDSAEASKDSSKDVLDSAMPSTARGSNTTMGLAIQVNAGSFDNTGLQAVHANTFLPPKRLLAKMIATHDCIIPSLSLNVVDPLTTWGRGFTNTLRYADSYQVKVPKYAFKLLLYKPGFYNDGALLDHAGSGTPWNSHDGPDQDLTFYISSKATAGIIVNGVKLPSHDRQKPLTESVYWGELHHGDEITLWQHDVNPDEHTKVRFECYWGKSKEPRTEPFQALPAGDLLSGIERVCLAKERFLESEKKRGAEEKQRKETEAKEAEEARKQKNLHAESSQRTTSDSHSARQIPRTTSAPAVPTSHRQDFSQSFRTAPSFIDEAPQIGFKKAE